MLSAARTARTIASAITSAPSAPMRETSLFCDASRRERKNRIAVPHGVRGVDRACVARRAPSARPSSPAPWSVARWSRRRRSWCSALRWLAAGCPARNSLRASANPLPSDDRTPATTAPVLGSMTSPTAFTTTIAATISGAELGPAETEIDAVPSPPFIGPAPPPDFPIVAPAPAPTLPSVTVPSFAATAAR